MNQLFDEARRLDAADPLAELKNQFHLNQDEIYLDGNSLGPLPRSVAHALQETVNIEWGQQQIRSWNQSWITLPQTTGAKIAPLIGAEPTDVICADSVSVNIFKLTAAALKNNPERKVILSVKDMFPTDLYIAQGLRGLLGDEQCELKLSEIQDLDTAVTDDVNVVILSQVNFRTGEAYDLGVMTRKIQQKGARVVWDVSHSVGVLPIDVHQVPLDYLVGCGYKFLNGGPGAPAFVYVRSDLQETFTQPLSGWMGHQDPFAFNNQFEPASGMDRLLTGTPNILSLVSLNAALDVYQDLNLRAVFDKAQHLTGFFIQCVQNQPVLESFNIEQPTARGAQVSLRHPEAFAITQALIAKGIICDFRAPDIARFGFAPLYTSYIEVARACQELTRIVSEETYLLPGYQVAEKVT